VLNTGKVTINTSRFWKTVEDCLIGIHEMDKHEARRRVGEFRKGLPISVHPDRQGEVNLMIYHEEPYYIACDIAQADVPLEEHKKEYDDIRRRHA
jgi:hypothetical protein